MPELPEVQTTVNGINEYAKGLSIIDVWTDYNSPHYHGSDTIKDPGYFSYFKKQVVGKTIIDAKRRAKNILINLTDNHTILIHMKMTGHIVFGTYERVVEPAKNSWKSTDAGPLHDPFNQFIRLVFTLSNGKHLVLSDMRKFAKVTLALTDRIHESPHLASIGPEPLDATFTFERFLERLNIKSKGKIKPTIMDQTVMAGVGNIYADESLWRAGIHPESLVKNIPKPMLKKLYVAINETLLKGIDFGGDSMSDYRNIHGERGKFQEQHQAYRKTGSPCGLRGCDGTIIRKVIAGRSGHFCDTHQIKYEIKYELTGKAANETTSEKISPKKPRASASKPSAKSPDSKVRKA